MSELPIGYYCPLHGHYVTPLYSCPQCVGTAGSGQGGEVKRSGCDHLDPEWPAAGGGPRGPRLCVLYPNCECGKKDAPAPVASVEQGEASMTITDDDAIASGQAFAGPPLDVEEALRILDLEATKFVCAECEARKASPTPPPLGSALQGMRRYFAPSLCRDESMYCTDLLNEWVVLAFDHDGAISNAEARYHDERHKVATLTTERDQAREQVKELNRELSELRLLRPFVRHPLACHEIKGQPGCYSFMIGEENGGPLVAPNCTCGLDAALKEIERLRSGS